MNRFALLVVIAGFAAGASAQQFRWIDKDGRVQYGDTPPPGVSAKRLRPPPPGSAPSPSQSAKKDEKPLSPEAAFRKRQQEREAEEKKASQASAAANLKRENCAAAQSGLRAIESGQRISRTNAQGERVYLDDAQIAAERARAQQAVASNCN